MKIKWQTFTVNKRFPLTISRGTSSSSTNILVKIQEDGIEGIGEASPFSIVRQGGINTKYLLTELAKISPEIEQFHPLQRQEIEAKLKAKKVASPLRAAIEIALHDWLGKRANLPLWKMWGLEISKIVPTSVTVGINTPAGAQERVRNWQELMGAPVIKVKLGNPAGIKADQDMLKAVLEQAPDAAIMVDANGGWSLEQAITMCHWLAEQGVKYVEQPLPVGEESNLSALSQESPLPIFVDESCFTSQDIPPLANSISGINIKIMKAGGLTEAMRMIQIAKVFNLKIMYGCYSDSTLANTAMSHLAPLADYLDLDSHLNLIDDPFTGATLTAGCLLPNNLPGLGVEYAPNQ